jgi:glycosyltransferase involved in cell wall biosynthesis
MRIVVDLQGAQASNSRRGIGAYSLALTEHLVQGAPNDEVVIALNGAFPDETDRLMEQFRTDGTRTEVWFPPDIIRGAAADDRWAARAAQVVREEFLASLDPDVLLVTSLFEGFADPAVVSVNGHRATPTAVVLYDLIPWVRRSDYLADERLARWYADRLRHLRRADHLLAISSSTRDEAIEWLAVEPASVTNIGAGADERFHPRPPAESTVRAVRARTGLARPHLLYTGGIDPRKNIDRLIHAYGALPASLRAPYQLAVVCSVLPTERAHLEEVARDAGLESDELVVTGFVDTDDLVVLTQSAIAAVFPSLHEGFGLPVLEAMKCATAVVASDRSSLPEVVGRADALFDPTSVQAIADRLAKVLGDESFRSELERHGLQRAESFTWARTAAGALDALRSMHRRVTTAERRPAPACATRVRPRMAVLTPLPPIPSGISDYSALLLPELSRHYDVTVVTDDAVDPAVESEADVQSTDWFRSSHRRFDRIVYHLGNSEFHGHMFDLLAEIPGVVVLHDFALSGIASHMDALGTSREPWRAQLYRSHGYRAVLADLAGTDRSESVWRYPVSLTSLQDAIGIIVHSETARHLADHWYGDGAAARWCVIPMPRALVGRPTRDEARSTLGLEPNELLVCAFGMVGPTKLSDRLTEAWAASDVGRSPHARLVYVGEHGDPVFSELLARTIERTGVANVSITGRVDERTYADHLAAADVGVQLRARSRGETSASAYDCLAAGLATIVNANGALSELPEAAVIRLDDDFSVDDLRQALDRLATDPQLRTQLGAAARDHVVSGHGPRAVADRMASAIEELWLAPPNRRRSIPALLRDLPGRPNSHVTRSVARSATLSLPTTPSPPQLLVDVSELNVADAGSGIQRVTRNLVRCLLLDPPTGFRVEPVAATTSSGYRYARRLAGDLLGLDIGLPDEPIDLGIGDVFVGLDLQPQVVPTHRATYRRLRQRRVRTAFVVYDLLPVNSPEFFLPGAREIYERWLGTAREADALIAISRSVMGDVAAWLQQHPVAGRDPSLGWFHLGGDLDSSASPLDAPDRTSRARQPTSSPEFLMVGTIEPRKGHEQALDAFELLWTAGQEARLTIVGRHGWMMEPFVDRLRHHEELGRRLVFIESADDTVLHQIYERSDCLLLPSLGEGFGLPLVEAARHGLPVLARDLPVFFEVAADAINYFSGTSAEALASALSTQIELARSGQLQHTKGVDVLSWRESTDQLLAALDRTLGLTRGAS